MIKRSVQRSVRIKIVSVIFSIHDQIKMIIEKKIIPIVRHVTEDDQYIKDIKDGSYYKAFIDSFDLNANIISGLLNIDGLSICEKSNLSVVLTLKCLCLQV